MAEIETADRTGDVFAAEKENDRTERSENEPGRGRGPSPLTVARRVLDDIDRVVDNIGFPDLRLGSWLTSEPLSTNRERFWAPEIEVLEQDGKLLVRADLPGVKKDDVSVEVKEGRVTIRGSRKDEREAKGTGYYRSERSYGTFFRSVPLPEGVDADNVKARLADGVLEVEMPSPKAPIGKQVPIE